MPKWNVSLTGCIEAKTADEAKNRLFRLFEDLEKGEDVISQLDTDESFDYSAGVSGYGD